MIVEITMVVTAIATAAGAAMKFAQDRKMNALPVKVKCFRQDDVVIAFVEIHPGPHPFSVRKITANGLPIGYAIAKTNELGETVGWLPPHEFFPSIGATLDFSSNVIPQRPASFIFAIKIPNSRESLTIRLYRSKSRFAVPNSIKAHIMSNTA